MAESTTDYYRLLSDAFGPHVPGTREARKVVYSQLRNALKEQAKVAPHRFDLSAEQRALEKAIVDVEISAKLGEQIPRIKPGTQATNSEQQAPGLPPRPAVLQGQPILQPVQPFRADPFSYHPSANALAEPPPQTPPPMPHVEWLETPALSQLLPPPAVPSAYAQPRIVARPATGQQFQPGFLNRDDRVSYARRADPKPQPKQPPPAPVQQRMPPPASAQVPQAQPPASPAKKAAVTSPAGPTGDVHVLDASQSKKARRVFSPNETSEPVRRNGGIRILLIVLLAAGIGGAVSYFLKPEELLTRFLAEPSSAPGPKSAAQKSPTGAGVSIGERVEPNANDLVQLAISQSKDRDYNRALTALEQARKMGASGADFYQARAYAYWGSGDVERALADYSEAIRLDPGNGANYTNRAVAYNSRGEYLLSIRDLERAIAIDPSNPDNWNSRCWARALAGQLQEAILDCNESLRLRPNDPNTLDSRGFAHLKAGQHPRAIADFEAALKLESGIASSLYGRGIARLRTGDRTRGYADIANAKTINPNVEALFAKYGVR